MTNFAKNLTKVVIFGKGKFRKFNDFKPFVFGIGIAYIMAKGIKMDTNEQLKEIERLHGRIYVLEQEIKDRTRNYVDLKKDNDFLWEELVKRNLRIKELEAK